MSPRVRTSELVSAPVEDGTPSRTLEPVPSEAGERARRRKERFQASLAWALDEYANTLAKLAK